MKEFKIPFCRLAVMNENPKCNYRRIIKIDHTGKGSYGAICGKDQPQECTYNKFTIVQETQND